MNLPYHGRYRPPRDGMLLRSVASEVGGVDAVGPTRQPRRIFEARSWAVTQPSGCFTHRAAATSRLRPIVRGSQGGGRSCVSTKTRFRTAGALSSAACGSSYGQLAGAGEGPPPARRAARSTFVADEDRAARRAASAASASEWKRCSSLLTTEAGSRTTEPSSNRRATSWGDRRLEQRSERHTTTRVQSERDLHHGHSRSQDRSP